MKILFGLGHPAHFHLYKNIIQDLKENNHEILVVISNKDILKELLQKNNLKFLIIAETKYNEKIWQKLFKLFNSSIKLLKIVNKYNPAIMVGCLTQMGIVGFLTRTHTLFNAEDDINYTYLQAIITYPFINTIITPYPTNVGLFRYKRIAFAGYHKLAYLHPKRFTPDISIVKNYIQERPYFIIRVVNQNAYHDLNATGISPDLLKKIIKILDKYGNTYISSEKKLLPEYQKYELRINPEDIHHVLYYADLFIADSQSMTVEAAMLGTPSVKFNNFAGKINVLGELENKYSLTLGFNTTQEEQLLDSIQEILLDNNKHGNFEKLRNKMLEDKIDVTAFMVWFIENYPESHKKIMTNPNFQYQFK